MTEGAHDEALAAFFAFLSTDGAHTAQPEAQWREAFEAHLAHPPCLHWLLRAWLAKRACQPDTPPPNAWLSFERAQRFEVWERAYLQDQKALEAWSSWAAGTLAQTESLVFRGIPLSALVLPERLNPILGAGITSPSGLSVVKVAS